jgi:fructose-1,6-bisphosphatase II
MNQQMEDNLGFSLMRATEAVALVASRWVGRGALIESDRAAARVMRAALDRLNIAGQIVIGERPQHIDPNLLGSGVLVGNGLGPEVDVVVDSIEGVHLLAEGLPDAVSVVAIAPRGAMYTALPTSHMEKLVVGPEAAQALCPECLDAPVAWTLGVLAPALRKSVAEMTVFVLNRPRHQTLIEDIRATGARVILRSEGDVVGALLATTPGSGIDVLMGVGGTPEGVVATCAVKAMGGAILARLTPENEAEREAVAAAGLVAKHALSGDDLVTSDDLFFAATGITDGLLLQGVRYHSAGATTHSLVLRGQPHIRHQVYTDHFHVPAATLT